MLWTIAVILLIVWLAGVFAHVLFPLVHILLVIALVLIIVRLVKGKKTARVEDARAARQTESRPFGEERTESPRSTTGNRGIQNRKSKS